MRDEIERMLPRHIRILQPVQDVHRPAGVERLGADQMPASVLDEGARDGIGTVAIVGRTQVDAFFLDVPAGAGGKSLPHQLGHVPGRRDEHQPLDARGLLGGFGHQGAQQKKGDVAAHARPDEHLRAFGKLPEGGACFLQPLADGALLEQAIRLAVARVVESQAGTPLRPWPNRLTPSPWC